ncbi:MAG: radical SAM protein [Desulfosporosinus sp. BRH_c37]|nr:MAG: radical SAM protein [Desulfosporosinus sp. BRH_c37]
MTDQLISILEKSKTELINREEALYILQNTKDEQSASKLLEAAVYVREHEVGNVFKLVGGIASVLPCNLKPNCIYCPYWRDSKKKQLATEEIVKAVGYIRSHGIKDFHLSGGTTLGSEGLDVLSIVEAIRKAGFDDVEIDVNCGAAMSLETLKKLKSLGVKKVGAVFETLNPEVFRKMKPGDSLEAKKKFAGLIGKAGLGLGTGILAGLSPEETKYQDYVDFLFEVKGYPHLVSLYVSKFYPFNTTTLREQPACPDEEASRVIALTRLVLRTINITGAQGWTKSKLVSPFEAGAGNTVGAIHITRTPDYFDVTKRGSDFTYLDNMEYRNSIEKIKQFYETKGIQLST